MQFEDHRRTALQYPLVHWTLFRCQQYGAFSMKALARYKLYCLVNRGTLGVNNLPRVVALIMPRSESNPRFLDHESNALPQHHRVT